jgi:tetratricopeptide (TPR) repeat protein
MTMDVAGYLRAVSQAESHTAASQWAQAVTWWRQVTEANPVSGNHWDRLGQACYEAGDYPAALAAYERAGALGVWDRRTDREERPTSFAGEIDYRRARCHARLGDFDQALRELEQALAAGLRDRDQVRADECWRELLDDERWRALLDVSDGELSRDEGWRFDLRVFGREVRRRAYAPFRYLAEPEWDKMLAELSDQVPRLTDAQLVVGLLRLLRPLRDGHAGVIGPAEHPVLKASLPVEFRLFPEGLFVTAAAPGQASLLGAQVLAVDGRPAGEVAATLEPVISRDNDYQVQAAVPWYLRLPAILHALGLASAPDTVALSLRRLDGTAAQVQLDVDPAAPAWTMNARPAGWVRLPETLPGPAPACERNRDVPFWFEYRRPDGMVYAQVNSVSDHPAETLPEFARRLFAFIGGHDVDTLVLDLRWNGGGNTFLTQELLHQLISCPQVNRPGGLFVITGRRTFSAAQNTATAIERHTHAIFVGEPTGSRPNFTGEMIPFELPCSKLLVNVSDLYWQTSWPMDRRPFIPPEIYAPTTFGAYRAGRDPAMEAIAAYREHLPGR